MHPTRSAVLLIGFEQACVAAYIATFRPVAGPLPNFICPTDGTCTVTVNYTYTQPDDSRPLDRRLVLKIDGSRGFPGFWVHDYGGSLRDGAYAPIPEIYFTLEDAMQHKGVEGRSRAYWRRQWTSAESLRDVNPLKLVF